MYIDGISMPSTAPMNIGNWFEYTATGQLPRSGEVPEPKTLKNGNLAIDYVRMEKQVDNYHAMLKHHGFTVESTGHVFKKHELATGISDVHARKDGKLCIIDVKTTGLFDNKWEEFGWAMERIEEKHDLMIQAVHYSYLAKLEFKEPVDFYFAVFSTKNDYDYKLIKVNIDEDTFITHDHDIQKYSTLLQVMVKQGFKANPSYDLCRKCYLKETCLKASKVAEIKTIDYTNANQSHYE